MSGFSFAPCIRTMAGVLPSVRLGKGRRRRLLRQRWPLFIVISSPSPDGEPRAAAVFSLT